MAFFSTSLRNEELNHAAREDFLIRVRPKRYLNKRDRDSAGEHCLVEAGK